MRAEPITASAANDNEPSEPIKVSDAVRCRKRLSASTANDNEPSELIEVCGDSAAANAYIGRKKTLCWLGMVVGL